jgi:hypothetical protein
MKKTIYLIYIFILSALFFYPALAVEAATCGYPGPGGGAGGEVDCGAQECDYTPCDVVGSTFPSCIQCVSAGCTPVPGGWSTYGPCLPTGFQYKDCDNPVPLCGGSPCSGNNYQACTYSATVECPDGSVCIDNPLQANNLEELVNNIINFIFWVGMALTPIMIIIAGFNFITAAGDPKKVTTAKNIMIWTAVGLAIILLAKGLVAVLKGVIGG